jgi:hypothetical protein
MKDINLFEGLHLEKTVHRKESTKNKILIGVVMLTLLGAVSTVGFNIVATRLVMQQVDSITLDMATYNEIMDLKNEISNKEIRISAYELLDQTRKRYLDTEIMSMLAQQFPKGVSSSMITISTTGDIAITCKATSVENVAYLIARLREQPEIQHVYVSSVTASDTNTAVLPEVVSGMTDENASDETNIASQDVSFSISIKLNN